VIPNHLLLNTADYARLGTLVQMNPPIRSPQDNAALWAGLHDGIIDFIATDHAPHTLEEKKKAYPNTPSGMPGVETSLPLMLTAMREAAARSLKSRSGCAPVRRGLRIPNKGKILKAGTRPHTGRHRTHPSGTQRGNLYQGALVSMERSRTLRLAAVHHREW